MHGGLVSIITACMVQSLLSVDMNSLNGQPGTRIYI